VFFFKYPSFGLGGRCLLWSCFLLLGLGSFLLLLSLDVLNLVRSFRLGTGVQSEVSIMVSALLDQTLGVQVLENLSGNSSVDFKLIDDGGYGENKHLGSILDDLFVTLLVDEDSVVQLILYLYLGPTLLLGLCYLGTLSWKGSFLIALATFRIFTFCVFLGLYKY